MQDTGTKPTAGVTLATVGAGILGLWNLLGGIAAVTEDDTTEAIGEVLYGIDISVWGWFWIIVGAVQLATAVLIYMRSPFGQALGIGWAMLSATLAVFLIFVAPIYSLSVLGLNIAVIWALSSEEFEPI